jgi:ubiquinone/menaquinone biosynthesis C-methylase UbiE
MSTPSDPRRELPGTYPVEDRSNEEEMQRLHLQDHLINMSMGGTLPEQPDPTRFQSVLDVGCGTGGWLIELAKAYPHMSRLIGVDVSGKMLDFANAQAAREGVADRVEFRLMDALRMLEFPNEFFGLVNQRLGASWLRTWDWQKLLQEYLRVVQLGGVIRITEADMMPTSHNSPALMQLCDLMLRALYQSGHLFVPNRDGIVNDLPRLLRQHGVSDVQTRTYVFEYRAGTVEGELIAEDGKRLFRTMRPFLQRWLRLPENYDEIYQQMVEEMQRPDFVATMRTLTAWGTRA